jgi:hypothetical protein
MDWLFDKIKNSACFDFYQLLKNIGISQLEVEVEVEVEASFNNSVKNQQGKVFNNKSS